MDELVEMLDELDVNDESFRHLDLSFDFINNAPFSSFLESSIDVSKDEYASFLESLLIGLKRRNAFIRSVRFDWTFLRTLPFHYAEDLFKTIGDDLPALEDVSIESDTVSSVPNAFRFDRLLTQLLQRSSNLKYLKMDSMADFHFSCGDSFSMFSYSLPSSIERLQLENITIDAGTFGELSFDCLFQALALCSRLQVLYISVSSRPQRSQKRPLVSPEALGACIANIQHLSSLSLLGLGLADKHCFSLNTYTRNGLRSLDLGFSPCISNSGWQSMVTMLRRVHTIVELRGSEFSTSRIEDWTRCALECELLQNILGRTLLTSRSSMAEWLEFVVAIQRYLPPPNSQQLELCDHARFNALYSSIRRNPLLCQTLS